jgi:hypothetical protein
MLADFCLRLACGLMSALVLLSPAQINPRFYRTHFLTVLGLTGTAAFFLRDTADAWLWTQLGAGMLGCFLGSLAWSLENAPGGRSLIVLTSTALIAALVQITLPISSSAGTGWLLAGELSSAALLGTSFTAMLMGHSYLIAPGMSLTPLLRLLAAFFAALLTRGAVAAWGLAAWTAENSLTKLDDVTLLLPLRWGLGFVMPLVLGVTAWQTTRIRSTQSATGILYVVVIFCFLGELFSLLLFQWTRGFIL